MNRPIGRIQIVGQGIAGTSLAWSCIERGIEFTIVDDGYKSSSSLAAAGLFNPLILKRRKLTWRANEFSTQLENFYSVIQESLGIKIFFKSGIYRRIASIEELNDWQALQSNPGFEHFLGQLHPSDSAEGLFAPYGYQEVKEAGYVDVDLYLRESRNYFDNLGCLQNHEFSFDNLQENVDKESEMSILATGYRMQESGFDGLAFTPAKGHTIEIICESLKLRKLINGPCFIIPLDKDRYRIGSTYSWSNFNNEVEEKEVDKLCRAFEKMCSLPYSIEKAWAGVRPATKDRKPFIGRVSSGFNTMIFNGMGSRAILSTPTLANMLLDHIMYGSKIWPEVEVERFLA